MAATHKVVRVRIVRGGIGENTMRYPARYFAQEIDRRGVGPGGLYSGHLARGGSEAWCLIILPNDLADEYATDPDMETISVAQADMLLDEWRRLKGRPSEMVTDMNRIIAIQTKLLAGMELSQEDRDALDPDSDVPGINRVRPLKLRFPEALGD